MSMANTPCLIGKLRNVLSEIERIGKPNQPFNAALLFAALQSHWVKGGVEFVKKVLNWA